MDEIESKIEIYCITNKRLRFMENSSYKLAWVGPEQAPNNYLRCDSGDNIFHKEQNYSELTFQYWYWKNMMNIKNNNWIGFCQKRRFWAKENNNIEVNKKNIYEFLLNEPDKSWKNFNSIVCKPIVVNKIKKIKMIKRGYRSLIKNPYLFFDPKKRSIKFHFDMHHGYGNLDKAIDVMDKKDRNEFREYVNNFTYYNPHIMFIAKSEILNKWFTDLFSWLFECEKVFGIRNLSGYDTKRLYAYLAERYLSFWFMKYTNKLEWRWLFLDYDSN